MLKDITLGQYFPGNSVIHRLDPRTKLVFLIIYIVALFLAVNWISYGIMLVFLVTAIAVSGIPLKFFLRGMKALVFILVFTGILNIFFTEGQTILVKFWVISISLEGVIRAIFMLARILMLVTGTFLLTYTTSPISLTDGLESLLSPLSLFSLFSLFSLLSLLTSCKAHRTFHFLNKKRTTAWLSFLLLHHRSDVPHECS